MSYLDGKITTEDLRAPYTKEQWAEFIIKLGNILHKEGLSCKDVADDAEAKAFIANWFEHGKPSDAELSILGDTVKYCHMNIERDGHQDLYPIIHRYHGHHVKMVYYFSKEGTQYKVNIIEVVPKIISI